MEFLIKVHKDSPEPCSNARFLQRDWAGIPINPCALESFFSKFSRCFRKNHHVSKKILISFNPAHLGTIFVLLL